MITKRLPIDELIDREAHKLALADYMQEKNITPNKNLPPDIESQIQTLLSTTDAYHIIAKQNILAQKAAHDEALRAIGLNPIEVDAMDLDL
jgi:hypothetical protein